MRSRTRSSLADNASDRGLIPFWERAADPEADQDPVAEEGLCFRLRGPDWLQSGILGPRFRGELSYRQRRDQ